MYVTRPLSHYYTHPEALSEKPPDGPGSGILVVEDDEAGTDVRCCWGLCWTSRMYDLPFPQNNKLKVRYTTRIGGTRGTNQRTYRDDVHFIPVLGHPLSSNRYYVIRADGKNKGKACECSRDKDVTTSCFCTHVEDVLPATFDHNDIYQQVDIVAHHSKFQAKAVATDGIPPEFLRRRGWRVYTSETSSNSLGEAPGINKSLRAQMPGLDFPVTAGRSPIVVVGKWYCPFMFVKEGSRVKDQMRKSMFYEVVLEQYWEEIYSCENGKFEGTDVRVSVGVRREVGMRMNGSEGVEGKMDVVAGVVWFKGANSVDEGVGLSPVVWERMRWEVESGGWVGGGEVGMVDRVERCGEGNGWRRFGCYVLVERFVLKRMDGSLAFTYEFKHTNKVQSKWE